MTSDKMLLIQIARSLGLAPGSLSNWQRRYDDFPEPSTIVGRRRLYRMADIKSFMARHDLSAVPDSSNKRTEANEPDLVAATFDALRNELAIGIDLAVTLATIVLMALEYPEDIKKVINQSSFNINSKSSQDKDFKLGLQILDKLELLAVTKVFKIWSNNYSVLNRPELIKSLYSVIENIDATVKVNEFSTSKSLAQLIKKIAVADEILDICSGIGSVLHEYGSAVSKIVGQELNSSVATLQRLLHRISKTTFEVYCEDSLKVIHENWLEKGFQAVIAVAPLALRLSENSINERDLRWVYPHAMRKSSADDFWIQSALAYLLQSNEKETYRSVISLRNNWFSDGGEGPMRDALVRAGVIEAVIALGSGMYSSTGIPITLLILRKQPTVSKTVRFIDARALGKLIKGRRILSQNDQDLIVGLLNGLVGQNNAPDVFCCDVATAEVLENGSVLEVNRYKKNLAEPLTIMQAKQSLEKVMAELKKLTDQLLHLRNLNDDTELGQSINKFGAKEVKWIKFSDVADQNSPIKFFFKNRLMGNEWTSDDVLPYDVVISVAGSSIGNAKIGRDFLKSRENWLRIWILRVNSNSILADYLVIWANYGGLSDQFKRFITGSTIYSISKRDLAQIKIPVPPIELQQGVAIWGQNVEEMLLALSMIAELEKSLKEKFSDLFEAFLHAFLWLEEEQ